MTASHQSLLAAALLGPDLTIPGLKTWNGSDPVQRFNVYRNNVVHSLVEALRAKFPVVEHLVGRTFFGAMAQHFVRSAPPKSVIMARYGDEFPDFVASYAPAGPLAYLADVARLEAARVRAYHAADARALGPADFETIPPHALADLVLTLHPTVRLIRSAHAIYALWAAHQGELEIGDVDPAVPQDVLVVRPAGEVLVASLPQGAAEILECLASGAQLGAALMASGTPGLEAIPVFRMLVMLGAFCALSLPGEIE
ncbi:MAG TPA: DNA-binding domain-containing protein [Beijerinckiaceae bacterium]|nr:DNA-binding domain-containing protein [Beijerinckiaceae bacterium]